MNATRLYTLKYRQAQRQVLSIGRVQTPTLAMIVNRQLEIKNFKPEQYWVLSTVYRDTLFTLKQADNDDEDSDKNSRGRITSEEEGRKAFDLIKDRDFEVTAISKKNGTEAPPKLFDLTSLQVECNKKFSFSAEETLRYIQSLYEKKFTTYPRVDTTYLPDDIYPKCPKILQGLAPYAPIIQPLMGTKLKKSKKVFDSSKVTDHHAIIPTGTNPANGDMTLNEKKVFDLIARRFIAVFHPDCKFATTTVTGKVRYLSPDGVPSSPGGMRPRTPPPTRTTKSRRKRRPCPTSKKASGDPTPPPSPRNGPSRPSPTPRPPCCAPWKPA